MTTYFVTGATGFIGRRLVAKLLARPECATVYVLVRAESRDRLAAVTAGWPRPDAVVAVTGNLIEPGLGVTGFTEHVDHVLHLAAVYDFTAGDQANRAANVDGTRNALDFAARCGAATFHHVSSVAVAGDHTGRFSEDDFDLGQRLPSPYHATKFEAEKLVREQRDVRWRVYRPAAVLGDSRTGEMDKIDGPYYFLPSIARLAALPSRLPVVLPDLGATNVVPVDYVVDAMDHLVHIDAPSGSTFHLVSPRPQPLTEVYNAFAELAGAPKVVFTAPAAVSAPLVRTARALAGASAAGIDLVTGGHQVRAAVLAELGVPLEVLPHLQLTPVFDAGHTRAALAGSGIEVPELTGYASALWRYWREHLDPARAARQPALTGRRILITGASSGIGRATALALARRGAVVLLVARRAEELERLRAEILDAGGHAFCYPCDLTDGEAVDALVKQVLTEHDAVDALVNNAGRSIRRSVAVSTDRLHDYERTMAVNYFAPVRLVLGLLPSMIERRHGQVVNVTTEGLQSDTPRFSAYLASKAALDEFGRVAGRETLSDGVTFTSVRMPLVRTPMIDAVEVYRAAPAVTPQRAARLVVRALTSRPVSVDRPEGLALEVARVLAPRTVRLLAHLVYRVMPESAPESHGPAQPPLAALAATLTRLFLQH